MSKTPVSMLHELMQRRGVVPQYEELPSEGTGTHMPTFYFRVRAADVEKIGKARSKKDAKHEAAKLALEALEERGIYHPEHYVKTPSSPVASASRTATTSPSLQINAVGILKEICAENNIPEPIFNVIADIGPAHAREFTVECIIGTMPGISATDLTKKKAKQAAAQKMLNRIKDSLPELIEEFKDKECSKLPAIPQEVIDGYNEKTMQKKKINWGMKVSQYHLTYKNIMKEKDITYASLWEDSTHEIEDFAYLQDVLNKLELSYTLDIENIDNDNVMIFISINSEPPLVKVEAGKSKEEVLNSLLKSTFECLRIMTK